MENENDIARQDLAERVRRACLQTALDAYENARQEGVRAKGAFEIAIGALYQLDLQPVLQTKKPSDPPL